MSRGFTLVEVILVIFILSIGIGGAFTFIRSTISESSVLSQQLTAAYLVQEGVEIVRNIRDSNYLDIAKGGSSNWDSGLTGCTAGCEVDYNDTALASGDNFLKIDGDVYTYDAGVATIFKRKITITTGGSGQMKVKVDVFWEERGQMHNVVAETELYDWF